MAKYFSFHTVLISLHPEGISDLKLVTDVKVPLVHGKDDVNSIHWQITASNDIGVKSAILQKMYAQGNKYNIRGVFVKFLNFCWRFSSL